LPGGIKGVILKPYYFTADPGKDKQPIKQCISYSDRLRAHLVTPAKAGTQNPKSVWEKVFPGLFLFPAGIDKNERGELAADV